MSHSQLMHWSYDFQTSQCHLPYIQGKAFAVLSVEPINLMLLLIKPNVDKTFDITASI